MIRILANIDRQIDPLEEMKKILVKKLYNSNFDEPLNFYKYKLMNYDSLDLYRRVINAQKSHRYLDIKACFLKIINLTNIMKLPKSANIDWPK